MNAALKIHDLSTPVTFEPSFAPRFNANEYFEFMGWATLPLQLKDSLIPSLAHYHDDMFHPSNLSTSQLKQWRAIFYWVECYRCGICTQQTALEGIRKSSEA